MAKNYTTISALMREVISIKLVDLVQYAVMIPPNLLDTLEECADGLYLPCAIEPVFKRSESYILSHEGKESVVTFEQIVQDAAGITPLPMGDFYTSNRKAYMMRRPFERIKKHLKLTTHIPVKGCEVVIAVVIDYLNSLNDRISISSNTYNLGRLVKSQFHELLEKNTFECALDDLILDLMQFVGNDSWNYYHYRISGTTLIIEKGLDYRIVQWHIGEMQKSEHYDHDFGGIIEET